MFLPSSEVADPHASFDPTTSTTPAHTGILITLA
jgi:hypothetical protein